MLFYTVTFLHLHDTVLNQSLRTQKGHGVYVFYMLNRDVKRSMALRDGRGHTWSDMNFKLQKLEGDIKLYKINKMQKLLHYCGDGRIITSYLFHRQKKAPSMLLVQHIIPVCNICRLMQIYSVYINYPFNVSYNYLYDYLLNLSHEMKGLRYFLNCFISKLVSHRNSKSIK